MVINTNTQAQQTANYLNVSNTQLAKSLARLSSGSKIIVPSDDAAGLAVSSRLEAQVKRLDAALNNVVNAVSFTQTQDGFLKTVDKAFRRMGELAMLAQDTTKSDEDRALYNQEFAQLKDYIGASADQSYNGVKLFSTETIPVTVDSEGVTFAMSPINLNAAVYKAAINSGTDSWKLTQDAWQVSKDGYKTSATTYKTSVDLWRTNGGTWASTDNGGVKFPAGSVLDSDITAIDTKAKTLAAGSFTSAGVTSSGFTTDYLTNKLTKASHGLASGDKIKVPAGAPNGTSSTTEYYVNVSGNDLTLHTTKADATAGTNIVNLKAPAATTTTLTGATATAGLFTSTAHGLAAGDKVRISSGTSLVGVDTATTYFVIAPSNANTFTLSATAGGSAIATAAGSAITIENNKLTGIAWEADDEILTKASHGLSTGDKVRATDLGGATTAALNTDYYVKKLTNDTFELYSEAALTTKVVVGADGTNVRLNLEGNSAHVTNLATEIKKSQFVTTDPTVSGEDSQAGKIASGGIAVMSKIEQDLSAFATELGAEYDSITLNSVTEAQVAITQVKLAISQIATDRAKLGAVQSRLNFTSERLTVTKENLSAAISRISDVDVAEEATQYARYQILVQSGTSMLREANAMPQAALKLLQ